MIEEINGPGHGPMDRVSPGRQTPPPGTGPAADAPQGEKSPEVVVTSELRELIDRVKQADNFRKERVHQVLEKLQRGELVTSETVRQAAERILREGP